MASNGRKSSRANGAATTEAKDEQPPNPYDTANFASRAIFFWMNPFIKKGFSKQLTLADLYSTPRDDFSKNLGARLQNEWHKELRRSKASESALSYTTSRQHKKREPSLLNAIIRSFGFWYLLTSIVEMLSECVARPMQAIALGWLIRDVNLYLNVKAGGNLGSYQPQQLPLYSNANISSANVTDASNNTLAAVDVAAQETSQQLDTIYWQVFYDGLLLIAMTILSIATIHPFVFRCQHIGMRIRIACCQLIYRHSLRLSNASIGQTTAGQMVNLLSNDVNRFDVALNYLPYLVIAPIQALVTFAILSFVFLGLYPTLAGAVLPLLLYVPLQTLMGRYFGKLRQITATRTDERIRLMNEIIPAMRVIKMYTWEQPFARLVELARIREVQQIRFTSMLRGLNMALFFVSSKVILFVCLITYVMLGSSLEPEIVFVGITLLNAVRLFMTLFFPFGVAQLAEMLISIRRLQAFLELPVQRSSPLVDRRPLPKDVLLNASINSGGGSSDIIHDDDENKKQTDSLRVKFDNVSANWLLFMSESLAIGSQHQKAAQTKSGSKQKSPTTVVTDDQRDFGTGDLLASHQSLFASTNSLNNKKASSKHATANKPQPYRRQHQQEVAVCALRNITFEVRAGELLVIAGRVGSGKSSVLLALLGELPLAAGRMSVRGTLSYSAQDAWIFAGSVRDNVLFGKPFEPKRYNEVLRVCSLDKDLQLLPGGDGTIVGERGVSLSGGQRARVNLARTIYRDADVYLLDDPLSAVDALVAKHIYTECVCGFLKGKAVLLATHQTHLVQKSTTVLYLDAGVQLWYKRLTDNSELLALVGSNAERSDSDSNVDIGAGARHKTSVSKAPAPLKEESTTGTGSNSKSASEKDDEFAGNRQASDDNDSEPLLKGEPSQQRAKAAMGSENATSDDSSASASTYWYYVRACRALWLVALLLLTNIWTQILFNGTDFWLSAWTDSEQRAARDPNFKPRTWTDSLSLQQNSLVYTYLVVALFAFSLIRAICFFVVCTRASVTLHERLFKSVLRAPIKFFDYSPIGILLNRVSRDMGTVDDLLPPTAFDTIEIFFNVCGTLITVAIAYPPSLVPAAALVSVVTIVRLLYMRAVRSIKHIEALTRSPVYSHLAGSLSGLATIRAFNMEQEFERRFDHYQDQHTSAWFLFVASSRWLCCALDWLSNAYIAVITIVMTTTLSINGSTTTGSQIGLAISSALALSGSFQWGIRQSTELESYMTSVSRIREYCQLPAEAPHESAPDKTPPADWPAEGSVKFKSVSLRYFVNEEPVLRALSFDVKPREKIGIVGRTGAGKSSIVAALFRLTEPFKGCIEIDGVDVSQIGLKDLRRKISIIPQEPILFSGTVRRNLDPFNEYDDAAIWSALDAVQLKSVVLSIGVDVGVGRRNFDTVASTKSPPTSPRKDNITNKTGDGLDAQVQEGGANFSVGQRQLMCLARAILRRNKLLVLDEATANVDPQTDKFIQRTIRRLFADCTVLTIAHRLNTIMYCDRVLVMDAGSLQEFDEPHTLLQDKQSLFARMAANTGTQQATRLKRLAEAAFKARRGAARTLQVTDL